jgi:hypothetical protein
MREEYVMNRFRGEVVLILVGLAAGCDSPTPAPAAKGPPPPPPVSPAAVQTPAPPPEKPKLNPLEVAMNEVSAILKRYGTIYAGVKDEATADKAVAEIEGMTARLRGLTEEIAKLPRRPGQDKIVLDFQYELTRLSAEQLNNPDLLRVFNEGNLDLGIKLSAAQQRFVTEGLLPLGHALASRQVTDLKNVSPLESPSGQPVK